MTEQIFNALAVSGVSICDFSRLTTISRVTLHRWKKDGQCHIRDQRWKKDGQCHIRDQRALKIALTYADRLQKAANRGRLPLKERYLTTQRLKVLRGIIDEMNRLS